MAHKKNGLLAQIETGVTDVAVPLSTLLQKCIVLGGQAGSEKMRDWARRELGGYDGDDILPGYRHVTAAVMVVITNESGYNPITQRVTDSLFPREIREMIREKLDLEDVPFGSSIGVLEDLAGTSKEEHRLIPPWSEFVVDTLNQFNKPPNSRAAEIYWSVSGASIRGVLIGIRTALAELVAELIALTPQDQDGPDRQAADQATHFVITGDRTTVHLGSSQLGGTVNHSPSGQVNIDGVTGNVAAGSSHFTQNYTTGFDITKVREFADLVSEIGGLLGLEPSQQAGLADANAELHQAAEDPEADKGRMRRAVESVRSYLNLAAATALRKAAIAAGDAANGELDRVIHHMHP